MKFVIPSIELHQFLVTAAFYDISAVDYHDGIGVTYSAQAVGYYKAGAALHKLKHSLLDVELRSGIHTAGGFVQN
jgi:hypothetical protein